MNMNSRFGAAWAIVLVNVAALGCDAKGGTGTANDPVGAAGGPGASSTGTSTTPQATETQPVSSTGTPAATTSAPQPSATADTDPSVAPSQMSTSGEQSTGSDDTAPAASTAPSASTTTSGPAASGHGGNGGDGAGGHAGAPMGGQAGTGEQPNTDACSSALLCDDFDDDTVGREPGAPWTSDVNGGSVEVSAERAFSGENSVHVSNTAGAFKRAYFSVQGEPVFPAAGQAMYGRMMMWLDATPVGSVHWTFIQGEGPSDDGSYDIFYRYGGQHEGKLMANFETQGKATDCWDHSETVMPTQTWSCIEWRFDTATDEMQFWLDGTEISDIHATGMGEGCVNQDLAGAWPAPAQFEVLRLGWEKYQESTQLDAWIDDVAVSTSRIGCPE